MVNTINTKNSMTSNFEAIKLKRRNTRKSLRMVRKNTSKCGEKSELSEEESVKQEVLDYQVAL